MFPLLIHHSVMRHIYERWCHAVVILRLLRCYDAKVLGSFGTLRSGYCYEAPPDI